MTDSLRDPLKLPVWRMVKEGFVQGCEEVAFEICHPRYRNDTSIRAVPDGPDGLATHIRNAHSNIGRIDLNIVDILAQGDRSAVLWQTRGVAGSYVGVDVKGGDTSAWLIGHFRFLDGLILEHVINWEPLRLMVQAGATIGSDGANIGMMGLENLRFSAFTDFADIEQACAPRQSPADNSDAKLVEDAVKYSWGKSQLAPPFDGNAYLSFADLPDQHGDAGIEARRNMARAVFAGVDVRTDSCVSDGGRVIMRFTLSLQHINQWLGMPGSGRPLTTTGSVYARTKDGKITAWIELIDVLRVIRQIGGFAAALPGCMPDQ